MANENGALPEVQALADKVVDKDKLFHDGYVKGVAEFIKTCATPMTIAIQGDWGMGKSSLLNLIEAELRAELESEESDDSNSPEYCENVINIVTVDVWRQFVANPCADSFDQLVNEMVASLSGSSLSTMKKVADFASAASQVVNSTGFLEEAFKDGSSGDSIFDSILGILFGSKEDSKSEPEEEPLSEEDLDALQAVFIDALRQSAQKNEKARDSRLVVFVDGLDHISPEAAVEFMDRIRTYLDFPQCVYVLAVDEGTVFEGSRKKLGDKADDARKKMLFDRLVQVPLRIPASAYNMAKYVEDLLEDKQGPAGEFAEVINILLSEPTPRSIKRCINTLFLYQSIFGESKSAGDDSLAMLLAAVILEVESTRGFDDVARCTKGDEANFDENLDAVLESLGRSDGINWTKLPALWRGEEGAEVDATRRNAFISWVRKLK